MKSLTIFLYFIIGLLVISGLYLVGLSASSRKQPDLGLINGQLRTCPPTPNCVNSEQPDTGAFVSPITFTTIADEAWRNINNAIRETGGTIDNKRDGYLHAYFMTPILRYIDDVELRLDESNKLIHIRSASRVGRSDMGANRARVERIRVAFNNSSKSGH